jgi:hypothetical protein
MPQMIRRALADSKGPAAESDRRRRATGDGSMTRVSIGTRMPLGWWRARTGLGGRGIAFEAPPPFDITGNVKWAF